MSPVVTSQVYPLASSRIQPTFQYSILRLPKPLGTMLNKIKWIEQMDWWINKLGAQVLILSTKIPFVTVSYLTLWLCYKGIK